MTDDELKERYEQLVAESIQALGGERAVCRFLGYSGHGTLTYRLKHPNMIRREHVFALELLLERVNREE